MFLFLDSNSSRLIVCVCRRLSISSIVLRMTYKSLVSFSRWNYSNMLIEQFSYSSFLQKISFVWFFPNHDKHLLHVLYWCDNIVFNDKRDFNLWNDANSIKYTEIVSTNINKYVRPMLFLKEFRESIVNISINRNRDHKRKKNNTKKIKQKQLFIIPF